MIEPKSKYSATVESVDKTGNGLRLEFDWCGDRFGHQIVGMRAGKSIALLKSVEGDGEELWPVSPPLQEFNDPYIVSDVNHGRVRLAIGAAGSAHWAVSVEVPDSSKAAVPTLTFDIACRVKQTPQWLGSTYDVIEVDQLSYGLMRVDIESAVGKYRVQAIGKQDCSDLEDCLLHAADNRITLACEAPDELAKARTLRWRYSISSKA